MLLTLGIALERKYQSEQGQYIKQALHTNFADDAKNISMKIVIKD